MDEMLIDYSEKIVAIAGHKMEFTKIEYQIIEFLSMHPGQGFDKEYIFSLIKQFGHYSEKEYIETVWGIGYRWKK